MTAFENLSTSQKLRASLHKDVRAICTESLHLLGMTMTKPAMDIVAELIYRKLSVYATDLEAFSKHAKRNTINSEDVKLLVRRNPSLKTRLNTIQASNPGAKDKRRKTVATTNSTSKFITTPISKPKETLRPNTEGKHNDGGESHVKDLGEGRTDLGGSGNDLGESSTVLGETRMDLGETRKDLDEGSSKVGDYFESRITDEVQDMSVEDTIDLTFD
ncbi:hypothetical protein MSG28_010108 [Choristoneura fumiferana]|uniref:Uncharacterized protein n=1 Tax=Choristoneura fumiferana TaxID=7141 RepID=A0ACC0KKA8_CHOFU|nr:hypothetical protein MSG28_010108 [Choristoneura fumiferana]